MRPTAYDAADESLVLALVPPRVYRVEVAVALELRVLAQMLHQVHSIGASATTVTHQLSMRSLLIILSTLTLLRVLKDQKFLHGGRRLYLLHYQR